MKAPGGLKKMGEGREFRVCVFAARLAHNVHAPKCSRVRLPQHRRPGRMGWRCRACACAGWGWGGGGEGE